MKRFKENPITSTIGVLFVLIAFALLFVKTNYDLPLYVLGVIAVFGVLLITAKDKLVDLLTLGVSRLIQDAGEKIVKK